MSTAKLCSIVLIGFGIATAFIISLTWASPYVCALANACTLFKTSVPALAFACYGIFRIRNSRKFLHRCLYGLALFGALSLGATLAVASYGVYRIVAGNTGPDGHNAPETKYKIMPEVRTRLLLLDAPTNTFILPSQQSEFFKAIAAQNELPQFRIAMRRILRHTSPGHAATQRRPVMVTATEPAEMAHVSGYIAFAKE